MGTPRFTPHTLPPTISCRYTTRVEAPKADYPVLLSNGNLQSTGELPGDRHFAVWVDPFPKPCYLFALVAGNLKVKERVFKTCSGRDVTLRIFVQVRVWRSVEEWECAVAAGRGQADKGREGGQLDADVQRPRCDAPHLCVQVGVGGEGERCGNSPQVLLHQPQQLLLCLLTNVG